MPGLGESGSRGLVPFQLDPAVVGSTRVLKQRPKTCLVRPTAIRQDKLERHSFGVSTGDSSSDVVLDGDSILRR